MNNESEAIPRPDAGPNQNLTDHWASIEQEIRAALKRSEIHSVSLKRLRVDVGATGIVLSGEVFFPWEREMAELVTKAHGHCMGVRSRIQVWVEGH